MPSTHEPAKQLAEVPEPRHASPFRPAETQTLRAQSSGARHGVACTMSLLHVPLRSTAETHTWAEPRRMHAEFSPQLTSAQPPPRPVRATHFLSITWQASLSMQSVSALHVAPLLLLVQTPGAPGVADIWQNAPGGQVAEVKQLSPGTAIPHWPAVPAAVPTAVFWFRQSRPPWQTRVLEQASSKKTRRLRSHVSETLSQVVPLTHSLLAAQEPPSAISAVHIPARQLSPGAHCSESKQLAPAVRRAVQTPAVQNALAAHWGRLVAHIAPMAGSATHLSVIESQKLSPLQGRPTPQSLPVSPPVVHCPSALQVSPAPQVPPPAVPLGRQG